MKNYIKVLGIIALTAVIGFSIVACGGGGISGTFIEQGDGTEWTFNNGTVKQVYDGEVIDEDTYTIKGNEITITNDDTYTFTLKGKELRLLRDGSIKYILNKK